RSSDQPCAPVVGEVIDCPFDRDYEAILELHDVEQVDEQPREPRQHARETKRTDFRYGLIAADGREAAFVEVMKRLQVFLAQTGGDQVGCVPSLLHGRRSDARQLLAALQQRRKIADDEDLGMSGNREVWLDGDAP